MDASSSYDELPYGSHTVVEMHPNRMAAVARLFGLDPPTVRTCRLLEIGCAEGGNAIPIAVALPEARVVGIDVSARQIAIGNGRIAALGLSNVQLVQADLGALDPAFGPFDYVCAHGVYSWIAPALQDKLLRACHDLLAPDGIAYVSYNTQPGWGPRLVLREMALCRARRETGTAAQASAARRLLAGVAAWAKTGGGAWGSILAEPWGALSRLPDEYFFHEYLEDHNRPCWFHEFAGRAAAAGLSYVSDALVGAAPVAAVLPRTVQSLEGIARGRVEREQYLDLLRDRSFRQSLLCRDGRRPLDEPDLSSLDRLHVVMLSRPSETPVDRGGGKGAAYVSLRGATLETDDPVLEAVLVHLWERSPEAVSFGDLARRLPTLPGGVPGDARERLRTALLKAWAGRFIDLLEHVPDYVSRPGVRPVASPLARLQAAGRRGPVSSLLHRDLVLEDLALLVLARLDGSRDVEALAREVAEVVVTEGLMTDPEGKRVEDPARVRAHVDGALGPILRGLARDGLLTA